MANAFRLRAAQLYKLPSKDWVLCGNGSDDLLTICTRAFVGQGELLRLPYPSYILYRSLAQIQGARWEEIPFNDDWSLPEAFGAPADGLKLAFLPNPNSPTGTMISREAILALADRLPCPLLVDEAYVDFADFSCIDLPAKNEKIIVTRTLSKSYGLAGLRFGYLVAQPQIIEQLVKVKDSYNCDALSIAAATAAIDDEAWLAENRQRIIATRGRLVAGLQSLGFNVIPSQANFVWCAHPSKPAQSLYEGLKAQRVLVRYMKYPLWGEGLRISVGTDEQTDACLALLKDLL
jgi:histidinol-phosphate aminotransferase